MATHSSTLAWKIPWTEEPVRLQSMGSQRVGHDLATRPPQQEIPIDIHNYFWKKYFLGERRWYGRFVCFL